MWSLLALAELPRQGSSNGKPHPARQSEARQSRQAAWSRAHTSDESNAREDRRRQRRTGQELTHWIIRERSSNDGSISVSMCDGVLGEPGQSERWWDGLDRLAHERHHWALQADYRVPVRPRAELGEVRCSNSELSRGEAHTEFRV